MWKKIIIHGMICIIMVGLIWGGYCLFKYMINHLYDVVEDDYWWLYQIDGVQEENNVFLIEGWAFKSNNDSKEKVFEILLWDEENNKVLYPKMKYFDRNEVNEYFDCEYDYKHCGFRAFLSKTKIKEDSVYIILLREKKGYRKSINTNIYLYQNKIYDYNPKTFQPINSENEELQEVVNKGKLRKVLPEAGIYIYQYNSKLYWIMDNNYDVNMREGLLYFQYRVFTTQLSKLPPEKVKNGITWDNKSFAFDKNENFDGRYRYMSQNIPNEYPVTLILTGEYKEGWLWMSYIRPLYEFEKN